MFTVNRLMFKQFFNDWIRHNDLNNRGMEVIRYVPDHPRYSPYAKKDEEIKYSRETYFKTDYMDEFESEASMIFTDKFVGKTFLNQKACEDYFSTIMFITLERWEIEYNQFDCDYEDMD